MKPTRYPIADVFSLRSGSDYSRFVPKDGAAGMMRDTWSAIGARLYRAAARIGEEARGQTQNR